MVRWIKELWIYYTELLGWIFSRSKSSVVVYPVVECTVMCGSVVGGLLAVKDRQMTSWLMRAGEKFCRASASQSDHRVSLPLTGCSGDQLPSTRANNWLKYCYWPILQILAVWQSPSWHVFHPVTYICWLAKIFIARSLSRLVSCRGRLSVCVSQVATHS